MPGPAPKRSTERRRRNKPTVPVVTATSGSTTRRDDWHVDPAWHPIAVEWFESLASSGQSRFYEPSDWATARYVAHAMSVNLNSGARLSGQLFASVMSAMVELLTTEGARRRARVELEKVEPKAPPEGCTLAIRTDSCMRPPSRSVRSIPLEA
jgi:hypothetical protein